jgi:single-strand DNA-binding protein
MVSVTLEDVALQTFNKSDGSIGTKLVGRVMDIELAGGGQAAAPAAPTPRPPPPKPAPRPTAPPAGSSFDDMLDDVPF